MRGKKVKKIKHKKILSWLAFWTSVVPDTGSLLQQHRPKINSEDRETTLCVGRTLLLGRRTQDGCRCHTSAHETINGPGWGGLVFTEGWK